MYEAKNFDSLLGVEGFSETMLKNHFALYQGYVKNTNGLLDELRALSDAGKVATPDYAERKRRFGWEFNGMRLHEMYFGNMSAQPTSYDQTSGIWKQQDQDFGTAEHSWWKDFAATGAMRGIGWVIWAYDVEAKRTFNVWINEHDVGHLAGCVPLLVMDVFEHAYMTDYGIKRVDYIESFFKAIDWNVVQERFDRATK